STCWILQHWIFIPQFSLFADEEVRIHEKTHWSFIRDVVPVCFSGHCGRTGRERNYASAKDTCYHPGIFKARTRWHPSRKNRKTIRRSYVKGKVAKSLFRRRLTVGPPAH